MMYPARRIGADLNQFSSPSTVHDHRFGHLLAWLLLWGNLGTCPVGFGLLDFKLHVTVLSQWSAFSGIPSGRNLHQLGFGFERMRHMRIDFGPETLWVSTLCGIWANCKSFLLALRRRADRVSRFEWDCE